MVLIWVGGVDGSLASFQTHTVFNDKHKRKGPKIANFQNLNTFIIHPILMQFFFENAHILFWKMTKRDPICEGDVHFIFYIQFWCGLFCCDKVFRKYSSSYPLSVMVFELKVDCIKTDAGGGPCPLSVFVSCCNQRSPLWNMDSIHLQTYNYT